ncbi:MAG TPA: DUF2723 domain-containing protein, partial [Gemmatimonadaceae bacterium]|nr:DUF2723 domain-containing protein [Gemmatimonadaceae bacterium]
MPTLFDRLRERKFYLYGIAVLVLAGGYADLVRGGTTVSAFLLSIAYCALIPLAIWSSRPVADKEPADPTPPSYGAATLVATLVLALYLVTLAPSTAMWDTSEYIAAAYTFGLPHPPGNPLFVIAGRMFAILPIAPTVAQRINILAALSSAASAGLWFLVTEQILGAWLGERWLRVAGAVVAAVVGATSFTVWNQSVVNEKVYTVSLVGIALVSWLAIRWSNRPSGPRADRLLVLMAYLCGLGYANHMAGMLPAPAILLAVLLRRPAALVQPKLVIACLAALIVGLSPFATQPIRAAYFPALNEGEPTACRTTLALSCTMSADTYHAFMYNFNRGQYGKPALADRQASFPQQVGMWWLYFKWQWLRDPDQTAAFMQALLAASFLVLGLIGGWVHYSRDRKTFWYFGALMFTTTLLLIYYLNFKLGASQDPASPQEHEVRDRDYFFIWSFSAWGVWVALGLTHVWESIAALVGTRQRRVGKDTIVEPTRRAWLTASPVLLLAAVPAFGNWRSASRAHHTATRNVAADLLNSVEPYGVLITVGDNDTFPLWYAQEVEGIRRDVVVANTSLLNTDWYVRQLIRRPVYDYDEANGPDVYRNHRWRKPAQAPLHMTMADADAVPAYYELHGPMQFNSGPFHATIDPGNLQYGVLQRADAFVLRMIQDAWTERPIYFARSAGGYPRSLGLGDDVLTQGLASKLFVPPPSATRDTIYVQGDGWLDVARTKALWDHVFTGYQSVIKEGQWIDRPSASMPALYIFAGAELADALRVRGEAAAANRILATTRQVATTVHLDDLARALEQSTTAAPATGDSTGVTLHVDRNA